MQYVFKPVGYTSAVEFYVDVSHMKSGSDSDSMSRRNVEANTIVSNARALGANAHIVALGDFNFTSGSSEAAYQTMTGTFQDAAHPQGSWSDSSLAGRTAIAGLLSESATDVRYRDDIQFVGQAAENNSGYAGFQYDAGSFSVFGNGGSSSLVGNAVNSAYNSGVFSYMTSADRSAILNALTTASDHLPVVADYDIVVPNTAPVVSAGADQAISLPAVASLTGSVSDDGKPSPPAACTVAWSVISGPGIVQFADPNFAGTIASFSRVGIYVLRLSASDSTLVSTSDVTITVNEDPRADFNGDGHVDGSDFLIWQRNYNHGTAASGAPIVDASFEDPNYARANGDANGDGKVDGNDFLIWQQGYVFCH